MNRRTVRPLLAGLLVANMAALVGLSFGSRPVAAASGSFSTKPQNIDHIGPKDAITAADHITVGFNLSDHNHGNAAMTLYLAGAQAVIGYSCTAGGPLQYQLSIPLSSAHVSYPIGYTANGGWYTTNNDQDPSTYQAASLPFTSAYDKCAGGTAYVVNNPETYSGTLTSTSSTGDQFHIQLHTAISTSDCASAGGAACGFNWNGNQDNLTPAYAAPTPAPTPTPTATPTATPVPTPSPTSGSSPASPSPSSSSGSGNTGSGSSTAGGSNGGAPLSVIGGSGHPDGGGATSGGGSTGNGGDGIGGGGVSGSGGGIASGVAGIGSNGAAPPAVTALPAPVTLPLLSPLPVISPLVSSTTASLFSHLPMQWFALVAAIDIVLALVIVARRRRAHELSTHQ